MNEPETHLVAENAAEIAFAVAFHFPSTVHKRWKDSQQRTALIVKASRWLEADCRLLKADWMDVCNTTGEYLCELFRNGQELYWDDLAVRLSALDHAAAKAYGKA
jgi:hypothetical protein